MAGKPKHGMNGTFEHQLWRRLKGRHYVHEAWRASFVVFFDAVGKRPTRNHSLLRIDPALGFVPGNVSWVLRHTFCGACGTDLTQNTCSCCTMGRTPDKLIFCSKCGGRRDGGTGTFCRACCTTYANKYRARADVAPKHKEYVKNYGRTYAEIRKNKTLQNNYGITIEEFKQLLSNQQHKCAICGVNFADIMSKSCHVDHCHSDGVIRGILCWKCNVAIALLADNKQILTRAIEYIENHAVNHQEQR